MVISLSRKLADGATLIVDNRLAGLQLEAYLAREGSAEPRRTWPTPNILTHSVWTAGLWAGGNGADRLLLSTAQSRALWRSVIAASADSNSLLHMSQVVTWAQEAWTRLLDWNVDLAELRARDDDSGFASFLGWANRFSQLLAESGWLDAAELNGALRIRANQGRLGVQSLLWAEGHQRTPALDSFVSTLKSKGCQTAFWEPSVTLQQAQRAAFADTRAELSTAMLWAQSKLSGDPSLQIALVVPPGDDRDLLLARSISPAWGLTHPGVTPRPPVVLDGQAADSDPALGTALDCLQLFSRQAEFRTLSRCLRSPFLGVVVEDHASRSMVETELRGELAAQLSFLTAYRSGGLKGSLATRAPRTAAVIDGLLQRLAALPHSQSPTRWGRFAREILTEFGWPGSVCEVPSRTLETWNRLLANLALLTPVVGAISFDSALAAIQAEVARARFPVAVPLAGITVLSRPEQVGPGYDAAWVAGMTDRAWPRPPQPNPLLPLSLQAAHQMPFATPADALSQCQRITARLLRRVPEIVFSYPLVENDCVAAPSPLLDEFESCAAAPLPSATPAYFRPASQPLLEHLEDSVPPLTGSVIPGGASTLAVQARCPLRAFVESRLVARPLDPLLRGISARQRGILTHRVLELLLRNCADQRELASYSDTDIEGRVAASVSRALKECFRSTEYELAAYMNLERDRLHSLACGLIAIDLRRGDFKVEALEVKQVAEVAGFQITCRIDRLDKLSDGRLAVIDYKTGQRASPADWFKPRLVEPQLPLYVQVLTSSVGAIAFGVLQPGRVGYKGVSDTNEAFPDRIGRLPSGVDWGTQQARWAEQLVQLVTEFSRGDNRVIIASYDAAAGPFAPLTRVYEQLAAYRDDIAAQLP